MEKEFIYLKTINSPLGDLIAGATGQGICLLEFNNGRRPEQQVSTVKKLLHADIVEEKSPFVEKIELQLAEYFEGRRNAFDVPLHVVGTPFQVSVWKELQTIPYGVTRSYMQQARALKNPDAIRAVAHANGANPLAIIIPCHRVIGKDGNLTGYGGGLWRKKWLLDMEARNSGQPVLELFDSINSDERTIKHKTTLGLQT